MPKPLFFCISVVFNYLFLVANILYSTNSLHITESDHHQMWEGKACVELTGIKASQVWLLLEDFSSIHKWLPSIDTCHLVDGTSGQPGCVRYCSSTSTDGSGTEMTLWVKERLLAIDRGERVLTYDVSDSNMGFQSYVATMKVTQEDGHDQDGCKIEWSFESDPVEGWRVEDLVSYLESSLHGMAERLQKALSVAK